MANFDSSFEPRDVRFSRILREKQLEIDSYNNTRPGSPLRRSFSPLDKPQVYGYVRVSTEKQEKEGLSLELQVHKIREFCSLHRFDDPIIISEVKGISGRRMDNRPRFMDMFNNFKRGDTLIVYSLSRIARNTKEFLSFIESVKDRGVRVMCIVESFDIRCDDSTGSALAQFILTFTATIAEFEANQTRERTQAAIDRLIDEGKYRRKPNFGWTYDKSSKTLVKVPNEQAVIDFLCFEINSNPLVTTSSLTKKLNFLVRDGKLSLRHGKDFIHPAQVGSIIRSNHLRDPLPSSPSSPDQNVINN